MIFDKICIIGLGLIGSSICRALRLAQPNSMITGYDMSATVRSDARVINLCDEVCGSIEQAVQNADLVIIATPVFQISGVAATAAPNLKPGCLISDVGSVKSVLLADVKQHLPDHVTYVPTHPMAGTEKSGPRAGFATLFDKKWCFIVQQHDVECEATLKVEALWQAMGARTKRINASSHDEICALVSHVPHLIAFAMMGAAQDAENQSPFEMLLYSSSGFSDFTRIAASDANMWRDIFLGNKDAMLDVLAKFEAQLAMLRNTVSTGDATLLHARLSSARSSRIELMTRQENGSKSEF